jgi:competence protein ComEA
MRQRFMLCPTTFAALIAIALVCPASSALAESIAAVVSNTAAAQPSGVVNINSATADELERLPNIGPSRARAIVALRTRLTQFTRLEELLRVRGIGRATFRKLRPMLVLKGPTTLTDKARASGGRSQSVE